MFIRFVVGADDENHRSLTGVITEARLLRDESQLYPYEEEWLEEIYDWFNAKLAADAAILDRKVPEGRGCWFKTESGTFISRMWDLVAILENHEVLVRLLRSPNPGKVVYEDDYQVLVVEWRRM